MAIPTPHKEISPVLNLLIKRKNPPDSFQENRGKMGVRDLIISQGKEQVPIIRDPGKNLYLLSVFNI